MDNKHQPAHATQNEHKGHSSHHEHMVAEYKRRFKICLFLTIPVLILSPMIQSFLGVEDKLTFPGDMFILFLLASVVYFYGGWPFLRGLFTEVSSRLPGMMTLIAVAITTAYVYSAAVTFGLPGKIFFWELVTLIDIMLLGHWIEMRSVMGASRALEELVRLLPSEAHLLQEDGSIIEVSVDSLVKGNRFIVKPGEKIPTDGSVVNVGTTVNESMLTGESVPVRKGPGDAVVGGAINNEGSITVMVEKVGEETFLSQVVKMVREAQETRSRSQDRGVRILLTAPLYGLLLLH